jgi:hypothetical protein
MIKSISGVAARQFLESRKSKFSGFDEALIWRSPERNWEQSSIGKSK